MEQRKIKWRDPGAPTEVDQLLASRYSQLLKWGLVLTRGDADKAQDIVQEFCLYFALTKPDLSAVANLDGYLYTCLRHIFLSGLARSSREALHFVSVAEFDSVDFALAAYRSGDPLQMQNDLRRICGYAVWRKASSKSASYFVLHFFHGYSRREIAELACLPISAIYNKLKAARGEVKSYLESPGKLRIVNRDLPPPPALSWVLLSSAEIFNELRQAILRSRTSDCLPEEDLLAHYRSSMSTPISCSLLAHLVSCERCLAIVDRHFRRPTLSDREPLDGFGSSSGISNGIAAEASAMANKAMMRSVHKRWARVHDHRPKTLSIAVNGQIIAFHDVQGEHSSLSARIQNLEKAQFIEVFSEQDVRLALLSIGELPPQSPFVRNQRVPLSDARWLELILTFDGLGLNSEVVYFDPALAIESAAEDTEESSLISEPRFDTRLQASGVLLWSRALYAAFVRNISALVPSSAVAWALTLTVLIGAAGYVAYRHAIAPVNAKKLLDESVKIETANLQGETEHQVLRIEEVSADGKVLQQGTVDLWKDGNGSRYVRRLYDSQNRLIAAKWRNKNGEASARRKERDKDPLNPNELLPMSEFWDQDLSARAFSTLQGKEVQAHAIDGGYELTTLGPTEDRPQLISATLVLERHLLPIREVMRVRVGDQIHELRFVQTSYERKPSSSVPDTVFDPHDQHLRAFEDQGNPAKLQHYLPSAIGTDVQLAELQIGVLYQLNTLGADTGEPIEVIATPDGRIRVSGTVADDALRREIVSHLQMLSDHQLLDLTLTSPRDVQVRAPDLHAAPAENTSVYDVNQAKSLADAPLRKYLQGKGLIDERLDSAAGQFSNDALQHAQRALQHAYALDRLGNVLSVADLRSISISSRHQWTEMVHKHASDLEEQLRALRGQMAAILPVGEELPKASDGFLRIEDPVEFERAANELLHHTQELNRYIGSVFTSNPSGERQSGQDSLLIKTMNAIPLRQAEELAYFALQLNTSAGAGVVNRQNKKDGLKVPHQ